MTADNGKYYTKYWNEDVMKETIKKFKQMQPSHEKIILISKLLIIIFHIFSRLMIKRPDYAISIPCFHKDCFDFVEYAAFYQIIYYALMYYYDIILNPHVKVDSNKSFIVKCLLVRYLSSFTSNKKKNTYGNLDITLDKKPVPLHQYRYISTIKRDILIKSLYTDINNKNIFPMLDGIRREIRSEKQNLQN
jgi:hypothetical protein